MTKALHSEQHVVHVHINSPPSKWNDQFSYWSQ